VGAYVGGKPNQRGVPIKLSKARDHVFGFCLLNDWSARDILFWEYVPLGPFNAKNFATTVSPWVVTAEALEPFKVKLAEQDPKPLPYLQDPDNYSYDVKLDAYFQTSKSEPLKISQSNFKHLYWSTNQQLAHHSVTGC
jgi:fumarylacetoacetase